MPKTTMAKHLGPGTGSWQSSGGRSTGAHGSDGSIKIPGVSRAEQHKTNMFLPTARKPAQRFYVFLHYDMVGGGGWGGGV